MNKVVASENSPQAEECRLTVRAEDFHSLWQPHIPQMSGLKSLQSEEDIFQGVTCAFWAHTDLSGGFECVEAGMTAGIDLESLRDCHKISTFGGLTMANLPSG